MATSLQCKQSGCPVAASGACMEGVTPASACPHAYEAKTVPATAPAKATPRTKPTPAPKIQLSSPVSLPTGDDLSAVQAAELRRAEGGVLVALAGDQDVGKTTLIASLYDRFLEAPWAGFRFAGSETLVGFERRLHLSRRSSGVSRQDTERTSRTAPLHFLHLRLSDLKTRLRQNLLLADLPGERFRDSADNQEICRKELKHIRYADRTAVCLDGDKIIELKARVVARSLVLGLLGNLLAVGHLDRTSAVDILITKWDKVLSDPKSAHHKEFVEQTEQMLRAEFEPKLGQLAFHRIAARPDETSELDLCHQMDGMISRWLAPKPPLAAPPLLFSMPDDLRESERYLYRRLPQYVAKKER